MTCASDGTSLRMHADETEDYNKGKGRRFPPRSMSKLTRNFRTGHDDIIPRRNRACMDSAMSASVIARLVKAARPSLGGGAGALGRAARRGEMRRKKGCGKLVADIARNSLCFVQPH
jgi:hypothetical protein